MRRPSCLNSRRGILVADASVAINLNATKCAERILSALPNQVVITAPAADEVTNDRRNGRSDGVLLAELIKERLVNLEKLNEAAEDIFGQLVIGSAAETLDDGEAATIAYAVANCGIPLIDERKAIGICQQRFAELQLASTVDLLAHQNVQDALGQNELADAVYNALFHARMRVPQHHVDWVIGLIGSERATHCRSLPKFRSHP